MDAGRPITCLVSQFSMHLCIHTYHISSHVYIYIYTHTHVSSIFGHRGPRGAVMSSCTSVPGPALDFWLSDFWIPKLKAAPNQGLGALAWWIPAN